MIDKILQVAIVKDDVIVRHLPKAQSLLLLRNSTIGCTVVGTRRQLADLLQHGLQYKCKSFEKQSRVF